MDAEEKRALVQQLVADIEAERLESVAVQLIRLGELLDMG